LVSGRSVHRTKGPLSAIVYVTNPEIVRELTQRQASENWQFLERLKHVGLSLAELDAIAQRLWDRVCSDFDCRECGICCSHVNLLFSGRDVLRLAKAVGMTPDQFEKKYLLPTAPMVRAGERESYDLHMTAGSFSVTLKSTLRSEEREWHRFHWSPCPFLDGRICRHYDSRADVCREYPTQLRTCFVSNSVAVLCIIPRCPLVFNVFELLKSEPNWQCFGP